MISPNCADFVSRESRASFLIIFHRKIVKEDIANCCHRQSQALPQKLPLAPSKLRKREDFMKRKKENKFAKGI